VQGPDNNNKVCIKKQIKNVTLACVVSRLTNVQHSKNCFALDNFYLSVFVVVAPKIAEHIG